MTINGPWNLSALNAVEDFEWTVVPLPRGENIAAPLGRCRRHGLVRREGHHIPRNACGFFEFWRAEELIALGRDRAAQAFAQAGR